MPFPWSSAKPRRPGDEPARAPARESPLRAELFSTEQLRRHAVSLAGLHRLDPAPGVNRLLSRLDENEQALLEAHDLVTDAEAADRRGSPAGEWLLDNYYLIEEQIRLARLHLPRTYSRELPRLATGPVAGFPRVYDSALELISHADGRVDAESVGHFVSAYESTAPLTLGELWAIPIMLRLGLIENLRRVSAQIAERSRDLTLAGRWADRALAAAGKGPAVVMHVLAELADADPPFSSVFVEEFCARLRGQGPALATIESWVEHRLVEQGLTHERLQHADSQAQAADQVSIGNSIGSLRFLNTMDWRGFVEAMSRVEQMLRTDPAGVYAAMDFATRDRYRHAVETLARAAGHTEQAVAEAAIGLATEAAGRHGAQARAAHVGYYLVDEGRPPLERLVRIRWSVRRSLLRGLQRHPLWAYLAAISTITAATVAWALAVSTLWGGSWTDWRTWLWTMLAIIGASQMAVSLVNLLANNFVCPRSLPRMDFSKGIPDTHRTLVVIPTLLSRPAEVPELLEGLEIRYLGNRDPHLQFALLTDFSDADQATQPGDDELLTQVREGVLALNTRYGEGETTVFHLFHRPRVWNPHERLWMGYERKRGKLEQFNALLRGGPRAPFSEIISDPALFASIRYILTLDTDTRLPRDAARKLIGTLAHPLNRPRVDPETGRVVDGYAIVQPRTPIGLLAANRSRFAQLSCGEAGIDPYTHEVSDVYQDVFGEGSYVGKGLYDLDAFQQTTAGRFPENLILSHDLIESGYARSALVGDVELHEDHPASFAVDMSRRHRWIRGDWQLAGWLLPRVPGPSGKRTPNTLTALTRWKLFDNLRRSLVPPAWFLLVLTGGWLGLAPPGFGTGFVWFLLLLPVVLVTGMELAHKPRERSWAVHRRSSLIALGRQLAEAGLSLCTLPYRAVVHLDAISASAGRMPFTRRGLLLWHTARYAQRNRCSTPLDYVKEMWVAPLSGVIGLAWLFTAAPVEYAISGPLMVLWLVAPLVAWWISRPLVARTPTLSDAEHYFLRGLARRTWRYFEELVNEQEHWLPPDNIQVEPTPALATRTSPTNIGLALLANLAAHDFGYLSTGELLDRTERTLAAMEQLERFRGHLYNWYDTRTLVPMPPQYVSSVDSGNLAGALAVLRAGLLELKRKPMVPTRMWAGLQDTLAMEAGRGWAQIEKSLAAAPPATLSATLERLQNLERAADALSPGDAGQQAGLRAFVRQCRLFQDEVQQLTPDARLFEGIPTLEEAATASAYGERAAAYLGRIDQLAGQCVEQAAMDFSFLYEADRHLLAIGFNVNERRLDPACYDLLASEARLASFMLIAQDQLPQEHWFALGRQVTTHHGAMALLSWSGSMFEYLMPQLIMPTAEHTLLDQTCRAVVARQIEYGRQRGVPWGVSESCFNATDADGIFQYSAFGVPGLGFKRGLADDLVVAPYASALALMVLPREACRNLEALVEAGYHGTYGLYEAIDFTPVRMPRGRHGVPLHSYMAHHQGMSLLAFASLLLDRPMQRRFLSDPAFKAAELLLHERIPKIASPLHPHTSEVSAARRPAAVPAATLRVFSSPHTPAPQVHLLSNGRYHLMVTHAGGGYSRWNDLAVTRWREDAVCDAFGTFCYLRDAGTGATWSSAYQPTRTAADSYEAIFLQGRAEYRRRDHQVDTHTEIAVSPEDDVEVRRITLTNLASETRILELTSYAEVVLGPIGDDLAHPAFSNLFVQTEILPGAQAILCTRRPRAPEENPPWMFHLMTTQGEPAGEASYETDRARFLGRCRSPAAPAAFDQVGPLSGTAGAVLDPIVAIRRAMTIHPDTSANGHFITGVAPTRAAALALMDKYRDPHFAARAFDMAWSHSRLVLHRLQANESEAQVYVHLAGAILHAGTRHRPPAALLARNRLGQPGLWAFGLSGDLPIVLLRIADIHRVDRVRDLLKAHAYWREKGLAVDLVILNEDFSGYRQVLQERIMSLIGASPGADQLDQPGGIFPRRSEQLSEEERLLLQTVARVVLNDSAETLAEQVNRPAAAERTMPALVPSRAAWPASPTAPPARERVFFNGLGGFTPDGREYVISLAPGMTTPAPWANVLANPQIGTVISESGSAYTWVDNAREFRLTPWHNDPVSDPGGEAFYIRDEETGRFWSPTPLPARAASTYVCRHGFGYSVFEVTHQDISSELWTYVATDAPVKWVTIKLRNHSGQARRLSVTGYWEWVLGPWRHTNLMHVVTSMDPATGALLARSGYNREFAAKTVFVHAGAGARSFTGSRLEFLGRNGALADPAALHRQRLSGRTGAGLDPCAAMQVMVDLAAGEERELVFVLGAGDTVEAAQQLVRQYSGSASARLALESVWEFWKRTLGVVHAETPDPALNLLVNGWLEYQALACRHWGRSGYYQSGGAYGFRDQLQDTTALLHAAPTEARAHLLRCAGRQFIEGDVQHWWHPPSGRGVRTHCSDDYLWLPYATCRYVTATGDTGVLDERAPYLEGRPVDQGEESYYDLPQVSGESGTLYEHCERALEHGLRFGPHGLPLIGSGDWNDGMNLVGAQGQGESVWLAFFLIDVLQRFAELARKRRRRNDIDWAERCAQQIATLQASIEHHGWDGDWYRRAYFDDGTPLGSVTNEECQIDSIAQSWAVLSGAADPKRARRAMDAVDQRLVRREQGMIHLFDPPFDTAPLEPGYIKGYPPGVRENGGQYTHAAIWTVMAFAGLGDTERAWELASLLNPIRHATTREEAEVYKVEPYVVAADIYAVEPHVGRGGWSWYTGAAGWMYRLLVEHLLGVRLEGERLRLTPQLPAAWPSIKLHYRYRDTFYHITVTRTDDENADPIPLRLDGQDQPDATFPLTDDHQAHTVEVMVRHQ